MRVGGVPERYQAAAASMASSTAWAPAGPSSRTQAVTERGEALSVHRAIVATRLARIAG